MIKTGTLETISYPQRRIKFEGKWFSVDPFFELDVLRFGACYEAQFVMDDKGRWFISQLKELL